MNELAKLCFVAVVWQTKESKDKRKLITFTNTNEQPNAGRKKTLTRRNFANQAINYIYVR